VYFITSDGMFVDSLFNDCRVAAVVDDTLIGGEAFGGYFGYDRKNKRHLLQAGAGGYRIYQIHGFDKLHDETYEMTLTNERLAAASRLNPPQKAEDAAPAVCRIKRVDPKKFLPAYAKEIAKNGNGIGRFVVRGGYDDNNLYLYFQVDKWVNNGADLWQLFKTGDCVDFQIATDISAKAQDPRRREALRGDLRILAAPFSQGNALVLYRHRVAPGGKAQSREFNSPSRSYVVDDVQRLPDKMLKVTRHGEGAHILMTLPFSELGIDAKTVKGRSFRGDFGVITGDKEGKINLARTYWSNKNTGLVNDVPGEMIPAPNEWGTLIFE